MWRHPTLNTALVEQDWATVLRTWRRLTGTSQSRLGALVGLSQPDVSAIEHGRRQVTSAEVQQRIPFGLNAPEKPAAVRTTPVPSLALSELAPDPDLLARVAGAVDDPTRVDAASADYLDQLQA